jgi:hypothetical protein
MSFWRDWKFFKWGFFENTWAWFHIMFGGIGAKIALLYLDQWNALLVIAVLTIVWEIFEFIVDGGVDGMIDIYGSLERWAYDSAGDILGANLMAIIVII